jgi:AcrR family transcriptional regulator
MLKRLKPEAESEESSERQREVLDAALRLLVRDGGRLTMSAVAAEANCSKETLYKWFGDREGLLSAIVSGAAAQVRVAPLEGRLDRAAFIERLRQFASDWLSVVSTDASLALNRLAMSNPGFGKGSLGAIVLENGRLALGARLKPILEAARKAGLIDFENAEDAFRTFFGLVARDVHTRLLLGDRIKLDRATIAAEAARAADQFMSLYSSRRK